MTRTDIINAFIEKRNYMKYLEIGVFTGENFNKVKAEVKVAVDPVKLFDTRWFYTMTSDEYFKGHEWDKFDVIFIDGLHTAKQIEKDIKGAFKQLSKDGVIILHDCNPPTEKHAREEYTQEIAEWNGTVWKGWTKWRLMHWTHSYTIDTDWGVGVIDTSYPAPEGMLSMDLPPFTYEEFDKNRNRYLNLISPAEFIKKLHDNRPVHDGVQ